MIVNLYAVLDKVSGVYDGPHPGKGDGEMIRNFGDHVRKEGTQINMHPEDFVLVRLGTWDDARGEVVGYLEGPEKIATGTDFIGSNVTEIKHAQ